LWLPSRLRLRPGQGQGFTWQQFATVALQQRVVGIPANRQNRNPERLSLRSQVDEGLELAGCAAPGPRHFPRPAVLAYRSALKQGKRGLKCLPWPIRLWKNWKISSGISPTPGIHRLGRLPQNPSEAVGRRPVCRATARGPAHAPWPAADDPHGPGQSRLGLQLANCSWNTRSATARRPASAAAHLVVGKPTPGCFSSAGTSTGRGRLTASGADGPK